MRTARVPAGDVAERRLEYLADAIGIALFASDRETLITACPQHAAFIRAAVLSHEAHRPVWIVHLYADAEAIVGFCKIAEEPRWWLEAQQRSTT